MNDLLNDIATLEKITKIMQSEVGYSIPVSIVLHELRTLTKEKKEQVKVFEKENMSYENYAKHMEGVGFDPQFLIDQEVARQDELKIDNKYVA